MLTTSPPEPTSLTGEPSLSLPPVPPPPPLPPPLLPGLLQPLPPPPTEQPPPSPLLPLSVTGSRLCLLVSSRAFRSCRLCRSAAAASAPTSSRLPHTTVGATMAARLLALLPPGCCAGGFLTVSAVRATVCSRGGGEVSRADRGTHDVGTGSTNVLLDCFFFADSLCLCTTGDLHTSP